MITYEIAEYHKIDNVFERNTTGKKELIFGKFRSEAVEFLADKQWICTEKIDGTNIRIVWDGHRVRIMGRTERANIPSHLFDALSAMFLGKNTEEIFEQTFGEKRVILFGEGYGAKIQKGGGDYRPDAGFILFDVYFADIDIYAKRSVVEEIGSTFGVDVVPVIIVGTLYDAIDYVRKQPASTIGHAKMEGLVCHPLIDLRDRCGKRVIVKVKARDFKEGD